MNGIKHCVVTNGEVTWVINNNPKAIGGDVVAVALNRMLNTEEINEDNLFAWLDKRIPEFPMKKY